MKRARQLLLHFPLELRLGHLPRTALLPSHVEDFSAANKIGFVHSGAVVRSHELTTLPLSR